MTRSGDDGSRTRDEDGQPLPADADDASAQSGAMLAHAARWWADFAARAEQAVVEWNDRSTAVARVTFTRQSAREVSIAHRAASTELRLDGLRIRVTTRRAEPTRHNMGAATLVGFRQGADGIVALANGKPSSPDDLVERVVGSLLRRVAGSCMP